MAGHASPYLRIPFAYDRGPGVGVDLSLQVFLKAEDTDFLVKISGRGGG